MRMTTIALVLLVGFSTSPAPAQVKITSSTKLTERSYRDIREAIRVRPAEEQWEAVPWRPSLAAAITEASEKDKPILLWMMNGHPCGMT